MRRYVAAVVVVLVLAACKGNGGASGDNQDSGTSGDGGDAAAATCPARAGPPEQIRDTLGNRFGYGCGESFCRLTNLPESPPLVSSCLGKPTTEDLGYVFLSTGRLSRICEGPFSGMDSFTLDSASCRPVACDCPRDCPLGGACRNGLCQRPFGALDQEDVMALCLAAVPWPATCEDWVRTLLGERGTLLRQAIAACAGKASCPVPADCRQP